ncbi:hypothetical protein LPJ61_001802 [Coemansia biformis]|uniref:TFIIS N-terminal domain-containing protein n=1 Tax=Coemansia biformis TaxID=1286918 RepID=A0A9W7YH03_9FUNG|nr:hypothetical protein LPJ61_001802 [Coemansia biformis]
MRIGIEDEEKLADDVLDSKPRSGRVYPVLFFGSLDYAWMTPENLEPYEENLAKHGSKAKNRKDLSFADALKQAQNPSTVDEVIRRNAANAAAAASDNDDEDEDEDEDNGDDDDEGDAREADSDGDVDMPSEDSDSNRAPTKGRPRASNARPKQPATSRKRMSLSTNSSGDDAAPEATPKRSRKARGTDAAPKNGSPGSSTKRDSDDAQSAARESPRSGPPSSRHSPERNGSKTMPGAGREEDERPSRGAKGHQTAKSGSKTYQFLMHLRHKLQKTVIKGPVPEDLAPVNDVLRRLEDFEMNLELIQGTKLGKVMRIIAESDRLKDAPDERFDIKGRAGRLAEKWRQLIFKQRGDPAEHTAPESPAGKAARPASRRGDEAESGTAPAAEEAAPCAPGEPGEPGRRSESLPKETAAAADASGPPEVTNGAAATAGTGAQGP